MRRRGTWGAKPVAIAALALVVAAGAGTLGSPAATAAPAATAQPGRSAAPPPGGGNGPPPGSGYGVSPTPTGPPMQPSAQSAPPPSTTSPSTTPPSTTTPDQTSSTASPSASQQVGGTLELPPYSRDPRNSTECVGGSMTRAADYARLWSNRTADWKGGDLGAATRLSDGRIIWTLGDNLLGPTDSLGRWGPGYAPLGTFNRNGLAVQSTGGFGNCLNFLSASPGWISLRSDNSEVVWPSSVYEAAGHRLYALIQHYNVNSSQGGLAGLVFVGTDVVQLDWNTLKPITYYRTSLSRSWHAARKGPDGFVYLFGSWLPPGKGAYDGPSVYVARTTEANLANPQQWQFWHGFGGWVTGDEGVDATPIIDGGAGWPSPWYDGSKWHVGYKAFESLGDHVVEQTTTSREPNGGWSVAGTVPTPDPPSWSDSDPGWMYAVTMQPDVAVGGGHLIFWSTNGMVPPGVDTNFYPYLIGPEFVAWQPGQPAHWGGGTHFSPGFSPLRVALLPGRVLAYTYPGRTIAQNANAAALGRPDGPDLTSLMTASLSSFETQVWAYPVIRLYDALFLRTPDIAGYNFWVQQAQAGMSMSTIANDFAKSAEFQKRYGNLSNRQFVELLYRNVFNREGDSGGVSYWTGQLDTGRLTRGQVVLAFSESSEYRIRFGPRTQIELTYFVLLNRAPSAGDLTFWTNYLNGGGSLSGVVSGVLSSPEFVGTIYPGVSQP